MSEETNETKPQETKAPLVSPVVAKAKAAQADAEKRKVDLKAQQEAQKPPPPAPPSEEEQALEAERVERAKLKVLVNALYTSDVGLTLPAARLFVAHLVLGDEAGVSSMGRTEIVDRARAFSKAMPIAWRPLTHANPVGFCKGLDHSGLPHATPADLQALQDELRL
jgi:hypothetical protein